MSTTRNAIAVGFVTLVVAVGVYLALDFVSESTEGEGTYRVWAVFPDASGLVEKSRVRIAGIPVGHIERITLETYTEDAGVDEQGRPVVATVVGARVDIVVNGDVVLYENARALRSAGSMILGDQQIVLVPGDAAHERLEDGDRIMDVGDAGLLGQIDHIASDIKEVTQNLKTVFGSEEGERHMGEMLSNLSEITASINQLLSQNSEAVNRTLENIDGMASDARPGLRQIVDDMRRITSALREFVETNRGDVDEAVGAAGDTLADMQRAVGKLDKVLGDVGDVTEGLKEGEGTVGRLLKDDRLIDDVEHVVEKASGFVEDLQELKTIVGLSGEFNFYDNTLKTTLQLRLQPREDKYYLIEAAYDPRGATSKTETVVETTNPDEPAQYREVRHETTDSLLFSFMLARRLRFATFRFGIKESSGGIGLDVHLLRDRVEFATDLYRFGDDVYPRLKALLAMEFLRHIYVIGGVNDILNDSRDYFVGLMIRFDDEDLKSILAFAPSVSTG